MSKQDPAEQVRFLVSCIGHTTNGRVSSKRLSSYILSNNFLTKYYSQTLLLLLRSLELFPRLLRKIS
jgi:hypothetical protein